MMISGLDVVPRGKIEALIEAKTSDFASTDDLEAIKNAISDLSIRGSAVEIPSGAILAFDGGSYEKTSSDRLSSGCPAGWVRLVQAEGRFILGSDSYPAVGETGKYELRKMDGAETHTLTVEEMPSHFHKESIGAGVSGQGNAVGVAAPGVPNVLASRNQPAGGGGAHNNMPPYIALYFCKMEGG